MARRDDGQSLRGVLSMPGLDLDLPSDLSVEGHKGLTALHIAARNANQVACGVLLRAKADPNSRSDRKCTPMHYILEGGEEGFGGLTSPEVYLF